MCMCVSLTRGSQPFSGEALLCEVRFFLLRCRAGVRLIKETQASMSVQMFVIMNDRQQPRLIVYGESK